MTSNPRILVVDDDESIGGLITMMLERKGFLVVGQVASGEEAILRSAELEPDLALMDLNLCGFLDGADAARYIFSLFHVPIIFLTASCDDKLVERTRGSRPYGFVTKPFTENDLISTIQRGLAGHGTVKTTLGKSPVEDIKAVMNAGDPVIITDVMGKVIFFNPSALLLLELSEKQLLMNSAKNVVKLVTEKTGEPLEDVVLSVMGNMRPVVHDDNTALVTRSGKRHAVSVTARPVSDDRNDVMGVIITVKERAPESIPVATH